ALWDSWEPDAVVNDRENHIFADPSKVHAVNYSGKYYKSRGPLNVVSSPQRQPLIIMAGTSPRGQRFATDNAELVIPHKNSIEDMRKYTQSIRRQLEEAGRDPRSIKVFFSIKPVMAATEAMAREKWDHNYKKADIEQGLADLSTTLGFDMNEFD